MGSQRPYSWFKYFKELGYFPIVVTRNWKENITSPIDMFKSDNPFIEKSLTENGLLIKTPYKQNFRDKIIIKHGLNKFIFLRKLISYIYTLLQFSFPFFDNRKGIYSAANEYLKSNKVDVIIATGEPFILFKYASKLSKAYNTPWIADYRDCWSLDIYLIENKKRYFEKVMYKYYEKKYVSHASIITTVAPLYQKQLAGLFPNKKIEIIQNGYFEENYDLFKIKKPQDTFIIAYAGTIYPFQPIEIFFEGIKSFFKNYLNAKVKIIFYGCELNSYEYKRIKENIEGIEKYVTIMPRIQREVLYSELSKTSCLLVFDNKNMINGKLYEYLPMSKRILMAGNDNGSMKEIIESTNSGTVCNDYFEIEETIMKWYKEWESTGILNNENVKNDNYSRLTQAKKMVSLISQLPSVISIDNSMYVYNQKTIVKEYVNETKLTAPEKYILEIIKKTTRRNTMLDIGVGGGRTTLHFSQFFKEYVGIDYSTEMIDACSQKFKNKNIVLTCADARNLACYPDNYFDFVLFSFNGIDSVNYDDRTKILNEMKRVAKNQALIVFSSHNKHYLHKLYSFNLPRNPLRIPYEIKRLKQFKSINKSHAEYLHKDYFLFKDGAHNFQLEAMYVDPFWQKNELESFGFSNIELIGFYNAFIIESNEIARLKSEPWIYYKCMVEK